jgi:SNF2 family DNA or RNA helicase
VGRRVPQIRAPAARVLKGRDIQDLNLWLRGRCHVLIVSYEMAAAWGKRIEDARDIIDVIIFDEAHYLKNKDSQRTLKMLGQECDGAHGLARWGARVWFLTGTPNPNDAADIWSMLRFCKATPLNRRIFRDRYYTQRLGVHSARTRRGRRWSPSSSRPSARAACAAPRPASACSCRRSG